MTLFYFVLALVMLPGMAAAHGGQPGGVGFYNGAAHPFLAIEQFLSLLGLGLLLGKYSGANSRLPLIFLAVALCAGFLTGPHEAVAKLAPLSVALVLGVVLAAALHVSVWGMSIAAVLTGWSVAMGSDVPPPSLPDPIAWFSPFAGVVVGVFLIVLNAAAFSSLDRRPGVLIAVRIVGSWIAAIAMMVLALDLRSTVETR